MTYQVMAACYILQDLPVLSAGKQDFVLYDLSHSK